MIDGDPFCFRFVIEENAMAKDRSCQRLHVLDGRMRTALKQRPRFRAEDEVLSRAQSSAPVHPIIDESRSVCLSWPRRCRKPHRIANDIFRDRNFAHEAVEALDILAGKERLNRFRLA